MDSITDKSKDIGDKSLDKSERRPKAVPCSPEFLSKSRPFDKERLRLLEQDRELNSEEKAVQTMDKKSPDESLDNSHVPPPKESSDKASNKASNVSSDVSSDVFEEVSPDEYPSDATENMDITRTRQYLVSSDKERRRLIKKRKKIDKKADEIRLKRRYKAGKKAQALENEDMAIRQEIINANWKRVITFDVEASRVQESRAAEDRARDLSGARRADGRKWSDHDQRVLELQRVNDDYIKLAEELFRWQHWDFEGKHTLQYRADEVTKLLNIFDVQWRNAYERIGDNAVKLGQQALHSAEHDPVRGLDAGKEPKVADEIVESDKQPRTTNRPSRTKKAGAHSTMAAKPPRKLAKLQQEEPTPQKLRRSSRLLAQKAGKMIFHLLHGN